jgi:hypothetical protein
MYIFGNSECLINATNAVKDQKTLWFDIINYLKDNEFFGNSLNLKCINHSTVTKVKKEVDF